MSKGFEVVQLGTDVRIDADPMAIRMADTGLESAEKAATTGDGKDHAAEFTQNLLPSFERNPFPVTKIIEDGLETCVAMRGKFQSLGNRVDEPPEQDLGGAPTPITFE
ncbi:MAG: hypothetical protein MZU84_05570 [Sphingobacterium sp.]|nr:hypothetical protein [Sphingobacterium sp.]